MYFCFDSLNQIVVDEYLRLVSDKHQAVYAIGDCASVRGYSLPCTAQVWVESKLYWYIITKYIMYYMCTDGQMVVYA